MEIDCCKRTDMGQMREYREPSLLCGFGLFLGAPSQCWSQPHCSCLCIESSSALASEDYQA